MFCQEPFVPVLLLTNKIKINGVFLSLRSRSESRREIGGENEGAEVSSARFSEIMACGISEKSENLCQLVKCSYLWQAA